MTKKRIKMTREERQEAIEYFKNSWMSEYQKHIYDRAIKALEREQKILDADDMILINIDSRIFECRRAVI